MIIGYWNVFEGSCRETLRYESSWWWLSIVLIPIGDRRTPKWNLAFYEVNVLLSLFSQVGCLLILSFYSIFIMLDFFTTFVSLIFSWFNITFSISNFPFQFLFIIGSECIIRWWNWLESSKQTGSSKSDNATARRNRGMCNCKVAFDDRHV